MSGNCKPWKFRGVFTSLAVLAAAAATGCELSTGPTPVIPSFGFGNGAPGGAHYNLNFIGVSRSKSADMTGNSGHRIFFPLWGTAKVLLCESGAGGTAGGLACPSDPSVFLVLDANATDGTGAFALPDPDPGNTGTTVYSVYVRALGTPGGHATNTTCGMGAGPDGILGTADDEEICSVIQLVLDRTKGKSTFQNVTKYLLYGYADVNGDGTIDRLPLFDDRLMGYFWEYDNQGLKLAQFRFYPCSTTVPLEPGGSVNTTCTPSGP